MKNVNVLRIALFASGGALSLMATGLMIYRLAFTKGLLFAFCPILQSAGQEQAATPHNEYEQV